MGVKYDLAVGLNKGHKVTKIDNPSKKRQSRRKGVSNVDTVMESCLVRGLLLCPCHDTDAVYSRIWE